MSATQCWSEFITDEATYNRACLAASGWSFAVAGSAHCERLSSESRYRSVDAGDEVKMVLRRAGFGDQELWGWVQAVDRGDEPRIVATLSSAPTSPHLLALHMGAPLLVRPRELAAVRHWDEDDAYQEAPTYNA